MYFWSNSNEGSSSFSPNETLTFFCRVLLSTSNN